MMTHQMASFLAPRIPCLDFYSAPSERFLGLLNPSSKNIREASVDLHCYLCVGQELAVHVPAGLRANWGEVDRSAVDHLHVGKLSSLNTCVECLLLSRQSKNRT